MQDLCISAIVQTLFSKCEPNSQKTVDLFTFTKEILDGKLHILWRSVFLSSYNPYSPFKGLY